jgi:hypothetical protein
VLDSGKLMIAATKNDDTIHDLTATRLNADGRRDQSYGELGFATFSRTDSMGQEYYARFNEIFDDGRVIVGEEVGPVGSADSTVNFEISADGKVIEKRDLKPPQINTATDEQAAFEVAAQQDGKYVVPEGDRTWRVNRDGSLDLTWGENGIVTTSNPFPTALVDDDGTILLRTLGGGKMTIARYFPDDGPIGRAQASDFSRAGRGAHKFTISWRDDDGLNVPSLSNRSVYVRRPDGSRTSATLVSAVRIGTSVLASYKLSARDGIWDETENGLYTIGSRDGAISDTHGTLNVSRTFGSFRVGIV